MSRLRTCLRQQCLQLLRALRDGTPARALISSGGVAPEQLRPLQLLSAKPVLYIANVGEAEASTGNDASVQVADYAATLGAEDPTWVAGALVRLEAGTS